MGNMCDSFIIYEDNQNEFQIWQGMIGAHFTPHVDELGNLSWTNNGFLPNPETVNVSGRGLTIAGIVATTGDLPETATNYDTYLVGTASPYHGYIYDDGEWYDLGVMGVGEPAGFGTPTATIDGGTGTPSVTITASGDNTAKVFAFAFSNLKGADGQDGQDGVGVPPSGTTGQVLAKASNTSYDTEWVTPSAGIDPATATPLMDGTAAVGTSTKYAREDHVHPTDTSRASATDLSTLSGAFKAFTVTLSSSGWSSNTQTVSDAKFIASGYSYIVSPVSASFADYGAAQIYADDVTTTGQMTFHCKDEPSSNLTVNVVRVVAS